MNRLLSGLLFVLSFLSSEIALASTSVSWNGTSYDIPAAGETGWENLSNFLIALGNDAAVSQEMKQAVRVATTTPVTVSDTTDCVVAIKLASAGAVAVNLPAGTSGRWFAIVDQTGDAATNNITITPNGAQTINGAATLVLNQNNEGVILVYSSTNTRWNVVGRFTSGAPMSNPMDSAGDMVTATAGGTPAKLDSGTSGSFLLSQGAASPIWSFIMDSAGDMIYGGASGIPTKLDSGTSAQWLCSGGAGAPTWCDSVSRAKTFTNTTDSTSGSTGAIITDGGIGAAKKIFSGDTITATNGVQVSTAASQGTLDYYRTAVSFTPAISSTGVAPTCSSGETAQGRYTRIGGQVCVSIFYSCTTVSDGTATGNLLITGLPFTVGSYGSIDPYLVTVTSNVDWGATHTVVSARALHGGTTIGFVEWGDNASAAILGATAMNNSVEIDINGCYYL